MTAAERISPTLAFLIEYLDVPEATGDPEATWERFQLQHLNNLSLLAITDKARQVGWSWLAAAEAVAVGASTPRSDSIFVSINQEEAGEKIRYAKHIHAALDRSVRPRLIRDNRLEIEFENGSRLISHPCRPVRGKAKARVYLDEFAHYPIDREIYQSALPVISKGGAIRIGSSPLGARGLFWEIYSQSMRAYPGYRRQAIPWWTVRALCKDVSAAALLAPSMATESRVLLFGSARLVEIFENLPLEDFQQEYECSWVDESISWIDWELIKRNQVLAQQERLWYLRVSGVDAALQAIDDLALQCREGRLEQVIVAGMDIGRVHDKTELVFLGKSSTGQLPFRLGITLDRIEFDDQLAVAERALTVLPVSTMLIDMTGMGMQLAETLHKKFDNRAQGITFTGAVKELLAVETKLRFQRGETPIPLDRDLAYQIHSIKRITTAAKNFSFDVASSEKHHADQFWALALAIWAGKEGVDQSEYGDNPLAGYRG